MSYNHNTINIDDSFHTSTVSDLSKKDVVSEGVSRTPLRLEDLPESADEIAGKFAPVQFGSLPLGLANRFYRRYGKRLFDLVVGTILFVLAFPIMAVVWMVVRLTSPGNPILSQKRVGLGRELVTVHKLRSMYIDHETRFDLAEIKEAEAQGKVYKSDNDPRVTPVGKFIRKTSIDELPQLWDVMCGEMSLVGPRPLMPHMLEQHVEVNEFRSRVRPGITGKWQVSAREDNSSVIGMIKHDFDYVQSCSLLGDLAILLKTPFVVLTTSGAQ